ncbi:hypothetical protein E2C01_012777 [Portunus trituberculatus]|uniref:Uncharacterized protein n=1 Tax=Portunus trituberculatus TaxID=210409 RepID=A0A5B7DFJ1_PORTR|nr:hypothetical protein [Portunus trituberculatus]
MLLKMKQEITQKRLPPSGTLHNYISVQNSHPSAHPLLHIQRSHPPTHPLTAMPTTIHTQHSHTTPIHRFTHYYTHPHTHCFTYYYTRTVNVKLAIS